MPGLSVHHLAYQYPNTQTSVFEDIEFRIRGGEVAAIVGPSGSGKSTLLSVLGSAVAPSRGNVETEGVESIQWVFQNPHGPAHRSAIDIAAMPALARGETRRAATNLAQEAMAQVNLTQRAPAPFHTLSGGEAQRLMLARAIVARPQLLLIDEPTAQLDSSSATTVIEALRGLRDSDRMVVVATHDPRVVDACNVRIELGKV